MAICLPSWYAFLDDPKKKAFRLVSGCALAGTPPCDAGLSAGNITCSPASMTAKAEQQMRAAGYRGPSIDVDIYTLSRYIASEVGSSATPAEKVAVAEAAVNRAKRWKLSIQGLLLNRSPAPNKGFYGPIHCQRAEGGLGAPYGRWASTSKDPTIADVLTAQLVVSGASRNFARGADDQADLTNTDSFPNPAGTIRTFAAKNSYWVGPLPGVDHRKTFLFGYRPDIAPDSTLGKAMIQAATLAVARPSPDWTGLPICKTSKAPAVIALGLTAVAGYLLYRRKDRWIKHLIP